MINKTKPFFIEDENFLNKDQKKMFKFMINNQKVPFFLAPAAVKKNDKFFTFIHNILRRADNDIEAPGVVNSSLVDFAKEILDSFCKKNKIKYKTIYRAAINVTTPNNISYKSKPHKDHTFPHKQLLIYLNKAYDGDTIILDHQDKKYKVISPKIYKGIFFDSTNHYHYLPTKGFRIVMIITVI
tara:strand:+ start:75 stop:626 length:552 start_codon:yes stop_codon:yes gene_type:complete